MGSNKMLVQSITAWMSTKVPKKHGFCPLFTLNDRVVRVCLVGY